MNRYPFRTGLAVAIGLALLLAGCEAPARRPVGVQRAPAASRPLTFHAPSYSSAPADNDAAAQTGDMDELITHQTLVKIGLLLPLSGRNASLGKALQDAAELSLFDKYARLPIDRQTVRVELLPRDTGDITERAQHAMREALDEGVQFIIGPVFADATAGTAPQAQAKNISVLSFSNTRTQASAGTYMFGFSPAEQTERIVTYALENGKTRIAVLAPGDALGDAVLNAAREAVKRQGFKLAAEGKYQAQGSGMEAALNSLIVAGQPVAFDAILIPEGDAVLDTILRGLSTRGVTPGNVQFLGTGLWDDADLLRRVNLDTAWFASSPPELTSQFETRFFTIYKYQPPRIASLAYDAVALAVTLATSGRAFDAATLTNPSGFSGPANGIFRMRANGVVQRSLAVMQVHGKALKVISPAAKGF